MTNLRFWVDGARTMGRCEDRGCDGVMMVVEDMGEWTWAQCATCLEQAGVHKSRLPARKQPPRDEDEREGEREGEEWSF